MTLPCLRPWAAIMRVLLVLLALGCAIAAHGQVVQRDVSYGSDPSQKLDLTLPKTKPFPTVVFVHGGSLTSGDKADSDYGKVCNPFPAVGIGCVSVNYRLMPQHRWPAQAEDVAAAIAWIRGNIGARGGDSARLFLFGHSSGAMLVAVIGSDPRYLAEIRMKPADLRGVIPMGSIMWDDDLEQALTQYGRTRVEQGWLREQQSRNYASFDAYHDLWPIWHVQTGMPPFLFLIAEAEQEHPPVLKTDAKFVEAARALGNDASYRVLAGRNHYGAIRRLDEPGDPVFEIIRSFIQEHAGR
jgi:acetyl esterase/lipase